MHPELPALQAANEDYRRGGFQVALRRPQPARGLVILTCMDARLDLFRALGLAVGDAHLLRNAGGRASTDVLRSLIVSTHLLATREIGVVHHTDCGLEGMTDEEIRRRTGVKDMEFLGFADLDESVRTDVDVIRRYDRLPAGVLVWGAVYEVDTGAIRVVVDP